MVTRKTTAYAAITDGNFNASANRRSGRQAAVRIGLFLRA